MTNQSGFNNSSILPILCVGKTRAILETVGVVFLDRVQGREDHCEVILPRGWYVAEAGDSQAFHSLRDDKERRRAIIDRSDVNSLMIAVSRYGLHSYKGVVERTFITDSEKVILSINGADEPAQNYARIWLGKRFEKWNDPLANWD